MCSKVVHKTDILKRKLKNSQRNTCAQVSFSARLQAAELKPNLKIIHLKETAMGNSLQILWNISEQISPGAPLGCYFFSSKIHSAKGIALKIFLYIQITYFSKQLRTTVAKTWSKTYWQKKYLNSSEAAVHWCLNEKISWKNVAKFTRNYEKFAIKNPGRQWILFNKVLDPTTCYFA